MGLLVGNKAKGRISKRVLQENKARQIFRNTNISYFLIPTRVYTHHGVRNISFSKNLACSVFLQHPFCLCVSPFSPFRPEEIGPITKVSSSTSMSQMKYKNQRHGVPTRAVWKFQLSEPKTNAFLAF